MTKKLESQDAQTVGSKDLLDGSTVEETNFRWAYAAIVELAKIELEIENSVAAPGEWPAGQDWDGLGGSSKSIFLHRARERVGIPHDKFLAGIRNGKYDVDDIYAKPSNVES